MKLHTLFVFLCIALTYVTAQADVEQEKGFYIEVYYDTFSMSVWEYEPPNGLQHIGTYPVTLTWKNYKLPKKASVTNVEFDPIWRPTAGVKRRYFRKHGVHLKTEYSASEEKNAMGAFKWRLRFFNEQGFFAGDNATRVHEEKSPQKIQTRDSSGCVRLLKKDGLYLTKLLWNHKPRIMVYTTSDKAVKAYNEEEMHSAFFLR